MDIFNRKRVEELEDRLESIEGENKRLQNALSIAESHISELLALRDNIPEDCKPGSYCAACEFSRLYHAYFYAYGYDHIREGYICTKSESCKNFVQREYKND